MPTYDFGNLATPVKKDDGKKAYDFGSLATKNTQPELPSKASDLLGGAEFAANTVSGMVAKPVSDIAGLAATAKEVISPTPGGGDPAGFKRKVQESMTYQPKTNLGQGMVQNGPLALIGKGVEKVADTAGDIVGGKSAPDTLRGAAGNAVREGVAQGAGFLGIKGTPKAAKLAGKIGEKIPPMNIKLTPEMKTLNEAAKGMGIELQPDQLSSNKYVKVAGAEARKVPLSGSKDAANQVAWERALIKEIGGDAKAEHLTSTVYDRAMRQAGAVINRVTGKNKLTISDSLKAKLDALKTQAETKETPVNERIFDGEVADLLSRAEGIEKKPAKQIVGPDGKPISSGATKSAVTVDGVAFRKFNSALGKKIRETTDGDTRRLLSDLQDALLEEFNNGIADKSDVAALAQARMQYAKAKDIAPIVGLPKGVSPPALRAQIRNTKFKKDLYARGKSSLKDLADIGDLLKDPNTSLTAERGAIYGAGGAVTGMLGLTSPTVAIPAVAGMYGMANLYNRAGSKLIPGNAKPQPGPRRPNWIDYSGVPPVPQDYDGK